MRSLFPLALLAPTTQARQADQPADLACEEIPALVHILQGGHYESPPFEEVVSRSGERLIEAFDPSRSLLLDTEARSLRESVTEVVVSARQNDCSPLEEAAHLIVSRAQEDADYVHTLLDDGFAVDDTARIVLDPDEAGWPRTAAERRERVRALANYQVAMRLDAGLAMDEARQKVIHGFDLAARRAAERRADDKLPAVYVDAFAVSLDPHTAFFTAQELADFRIDTQLSLEGIGAALVPEDGFTKVQSIVPGGPADRDGTLQPGDFITAVSQDGEPPVDVIDMDLQDVVQLIRGPKGSRVTLTLLRKGKTTRSFDLTLARDKIDLEDQAAKLEIRLVERGDSSVKVGVLDLPSFYGGERGGRSSSGDVARLLEDARKEGVAGIVLDLSRNGGGLLNEAVDIAGLFLRKGAVVATRGSDGQVEVLDDRDTAINWSGPLVVLTSPVSASGSEILAGALRDYNRAVIVGMDDHTFGKGTVQQLLPLPGEVGAVKITTGMFFTPSGRSTQRVGVASDVVVPSPLDGDEIGEKALDWALPPGSISPFRSSTVTGWGDDTWVPVDDSVVARLGKSSSARVQGDPVLQKVAAQAAADKDIGDVVSLGELLAKSHAGADDDEVEWEAAHAAFVAEGAQVLADLVQMRR